MLFHLINKKFHLIHGVMFIIINLYLATQLAPLTENIGKLTIRVEALERQSSTERREILNILERLEDKIDRNTDRIIQLK